MHFYIKVKFFQLYKPDDRVDCSVKSVSLNRTVLLPKFVVSQLVLVVHESSHSTYRSSLVHEYRNDCQSIVKVVLIMMYKTYF